MNIKFRLETPADYYSVELMTREAFWKTFWEEGQKICDEHLLLHRLRTCASFVPELNTVAEIDDRPVGHIIFTKTVIEDNAGNRHEALTFGPLTVSPEHQSKGIGRALMQHTFDKAKQLGFRAVIIYGHPDYYPRAGFRRAADFGITTPDGSVFDALMVYPLYDGAMNDIHGKVYLDPVYGSLTQQDALEFDKKFPPKDLHIPAPVDVLLKRLAPAARKAIEGLNLCSLTAVKTRSEREILSLSGVDKDAIEVIHAVMKEHELAWGNAVTDKP
jgi:predicted N-acetyltransferase YhbS